MRHARASTGTRCDRHALASRRHRLLASADHLVQDIPLALDLLHAQGHTNSRFRIAHSDDDLDQILVRSERLPVVVDLDPSQPCDVWLDAVVAWHLRNANGGTAAPRHEEQSRSDDGECCEPAKAAAIQDDALTDCLRLFRA